MLFNDRHKKHKIIKKALYCDKQLKKVNIDTVKKISTVFFFSFAQSQNFYFLASLGWHYITEILREFSYSGEILLTFRAGLCW